MSLKPESFYILLTKEGRYIDRDGGFTWSRSYARTFTGAEASALIEPMTAVEVDARGVSVTQLRQDDTLPSLSNGVPTMSS